MLHLELDKTGSGGEWGGAYRSGVELWEETGKRMSQTDQDR